MRVENTLFSIAGNAETGIRGGKDGIRGRAWITGDGLSNSQKLGVKGARWKSGVWWRNRNSEGEEEDL